MGNFDFGTLGTETFTSSAGRSLKPYGIYSVSLTDASLKDIQGTKDPNAVYHTIHLEFTGKGEDEGGTYQQNLFIPSTEDDLKRPVYTNSQTGKEYERPSRFESYRYTLMQIVEAINPESAAKIKANASKINLLAKSEKREPIDIFNEWVIKALSNKKDVVTNLKLVGRNVNGTIYANLPNSCGINHEGNIFVTQFIGKNLMFNSYEQQQAEAYKNAKPTAMPNNPDVASKDEIDGIDELAIDL